MKANMFCVYIVAATSYVFPIDAVSLSARQDASNLRGQAPMESSALIETGANASLEEISHGVNSSLAFLEGLPSSNTSQNQALEDQVTDLFKLSKLRDSMTKEQFAATPFGKSVDKILHLIKGVMMPKVLEAHDANQKELNRLSDDVTKCGTTKNSQISRANRKKALYLKYSPLHQTCRSGEAGAYQEKATCWEEESDKKKIKDLKCSAFAMVKKQVGDQTANKQIMKKGGSESTESYVHRISSTICGKCAGKKCKKDDGEGGGEKNEKCGYDPYTCGCGMSCKFQKAKDACDAATRDWQAQVRKCKAYDKQYHEKKNECDSLQDQMDDSACKRAVQMKDACESYEECYFDKTKAYRSLEGMVKKEEVDRKAEWRGLKRMNCLIKAFADKKVSGKAVDECKSQTHSTEHLIIDYPNITQLVKCSVPELYPNTPLYKKMNFAPLPALAKGKQDTYECAGIQEISTVPADGSPKKCKCERVTLNGPYSPGPMVKCVNCLDIRRSLDKSSCPDGTKLFSPRSQTDWKTFFNSAKPLHAPNFIVDITRPQNGCGGCTRFPMNSAQKWQSSWVTSDNTKWWLRGRPFAEPNGDYQANCFLNIKKGSTDNNVKFNDNACNNHAKSYYCQAKELSLQPKPGSPKECICKQIALTGKYSAGSLIKCTGCLRVSKSTQKNSCPIGTKIFSPRSRADWSTFIASATPLRSPNWIVDITQPQNGCGGCSRNAMNSHNPAQATWRTTDSTPWFLRSTKYAEPTGDYQANCYMDIGTIANENSVTFSAKKCSYNSNSYYCQPAKIKKKPTPPPPPAPAPLPPKPEAGGEYRGFKCASGAYTGINKKCDHFTDVSQATCWARCQNSSHAMDNPGCDHFSGVPDCVASVYHKKLKICMLYRKCTSLVHWKGHPDIVTKVKEDYDPSAPIWQPPLESSRCSSKPYAIAKGMHVAKCRSICETSGLVNDDSKQKRCEAFDIKRKKGENEVGDCRFYEECAKKKKEIGYTAFTKVPRPTKAGKLEKKKIKKKNDDDDNDNDDE